MFSREGEGRCGVDRCALFVDAGYVLADGGMAVHGTRRRESVSWDYQGLLKLLASLATERSGLPLLRCYWYEATVEGRRGADHDTLADIPGVKLRIAKMRPGRREGVESEIHRDLETLARNKAVSDAFVVSGEEDLAPVIADVQDLGLRVTLLNIAAEGDWEVSRALRQECDDLVDVSSEHLRPYVELISGAEPPHADEHDGAPLVALRPPAARLDPAPAAQDAPPAAPAAPAASAVPSAMPVPSAAPVASPGPSAPSAPREPVAAPAAAGPARTEYAGIPVEAGVQQEAYAFRDTIPVVGQEAGPVRQDSAPRQELYAAPVALPAAAVGQPPEFAAQPADLPPARTRPMADLSGYAPGAPRDQLPGDPSIRDRFARESLPGEPGPAPQPVAGMAGTAQIHRLPTRGGGPGVQGPGQPSAGQPGPAGPSTTAQPAIGQPAAPVTPIVPGYGPAHNGSPYSGPQPVVPAGPPAGSSGLAQQAPLGLPALPGGQPDGAGLHGVASPVPSAATAGQVNTSGPLYAAGPVGYPNGNGQSSVSLAEAVQSAHDEGQEFGASVARDAPVLWLEAVLARKPRMPSDLEARLLQGSALPIDFLLHDEVRHALRRGFWDALERARR
jgi:NYN domain